MVARTPLCGSINCGLTTYAKVLRVLDRSEQNLEQLTEPGGTTLQTQFVRDLASPLMRVAEELRPSFCSLRSSTRKTFA